MNEAVFRSVKRICYAGLDSVTLRREVANRMAGAIAFDGHAFGTVDPDTGLLTHTLAEGVPSALLLNYSEWLYPMYAAIALADAARAGKTFVRLEEELPQLQEVMLASGLADAGHLALTVGGCLWGKWCLMRERATFQSLRGEQELLERSAPHIARGLRAAALVDQAVAPAPAPNAPGVLALDARGRPTLRTPALAPMLEDLGDVGIEAPGGVPLSILNVVANIRRVHAVVEQGEAPAEATLRARGRSGRWYVIRAALAEPDAAADAVAVVIVRALTPREMAPVLTRLYGLSRREREVAAAVARGESTKRIALRLGISPHTVKEHVERACDKIGVRGRRALVARLYFDAYAARRRESA